MSLPSTSGAINAADVIGLGADATVFGVGQHTSFALVEELLERGETDSRYALVVKDCFDWREDRPHLSSVLVECGPNSFAVNDKVATSGSPIRRMVDAYETT